MSERILYTIGHSKHPIEKLLGLLKLHGIDTLVDVRTYPMSRFNPQFNKKKLDESLAAEKIAYMFMGDSLGGRPEGEQFYDEDGRTLYYRMAQTAVFRQSLQQLTDVAETKCVAIMCSEEDPESCHRKLLVGRALLQTTEITLRHIRSDGSVFEENSKIWASGILAATEKQDPTTWRSPKPSSKEKRKS